jgi:hypothetical protein
MLQPGQLRTAFSPYLQDMECCRAARAHWCLLHVVLCLPDICGALESPSGEAAKTRYIEWCDKYLRRPALAGVEVYRMRCKVLHQGRARGDGTGRYERFAFGKPAGGVIDHLRVDGDALHVDVESLLSDLLAALDRWIGELESDPSGPAAGHVSTNLAKLVRITPHNVPFSVGHATAGQALTTTVLKTY